MSQKITHNIRTNGYGTPKKDKNELPSNTKLLYTIINKVTREDHKHSSPKVEKDGTLKECKELFKQGANPTVLNEVLIKLEKSSEKHLVYYIQRFLPELKEEIKQSKKLGQEKAKKIEQIILEVISQSINKNLSTQSRRGSIESEDSGFESVNSSEVDEIDERTSNESISDTIISEEITVHSEDSGIESGNSSEVEVGDYHTDEKDSIFSEPISYIVNEDQEIGNGVTNNNAQLLEAIKNGNQKRFKEYLESCTDIGSVKDEKGNNVLHLIASLRKEKKCDFLDTLVESSKEDLEQLVSGENQDKKTPLQVALINKITKGKHGSNTIQNNDNTLKFLVRLLEHGASHDQLRLSSKELQNLNEEQKTYYCNFLETLLGLKPEIEAKEAIVHTVNTPDSNGNYLLHLAIENKERFEYLLQKNADITVEDGNGNNVLHHIASLKGEQKVILLGLILDLVERKVISKEKFSEAVNATNKEGWMPLQVALIKKARKGKHLSQVKTISNPAINDDNTTKFCVMSLQNGADPSCLDLKDDKSYTSKSYRVLRNLKNDKTIPQEAQEKARKAKVQLEKRYNTKTLSKKFQHATHKLGSGTRKTAFNVGKALSAVRKRLDLENRILRGSIMAMTAIVVAITAAAFFQSQMTAVVAIPIILTAGIVFAATLKFNSIKKHFEKPTNKEPKKDPKSEMKNTSAESPRHIVPHHS